MEKKKTGLQNIEGRVRHIKRTGLEVERMEDVGI